PAIFTWPRMKPTDRSSEPSCNACASAGVHVNVIVAGSGDAPSPCAASAPPSMRAQLRATSFLPAATTNSTTTGPVGPADSAGMARMGTKAGEHVVFELAVGHTVVDERSREHELLPREDLAHHVIGEAHPEPVRIDLRPMSEQRFATLEEIVADVDQRR